MRITPHIVDDDDNTISLGSRSPESLPLDRSLLVISRPPLEILPDETVSPIISSISSPITTVAKPTPDNGNKKHMVLETQMKRIFEGDDSWEDVDTANGYKVHDFGLPSIEIR
jgi:hypothetical protein